MLVGRTERVARGPGRIVCGWLAACFALLLAGCGGGGVSSGSPYVNETLALSVYSNASGTSGVPPSVLNSVVQDQSGQAESFNIIVEDAAPSGSSIELQFNIIHDSGTGHNPVAPPGVTLPLPAATDGAYVDPTQYLDATPLYFDSYNRVCIRSQGAQPYVTLDSRLASSPIWVASASPIVGGYAYGIHTAARSMRTGPHDIVMYFYGVNVANQGPANSSGVDAPTVGLVFGTNIAGGSGAVDLTAPGSFNPSYGQAYSVSFTIPTPAGFGMVKALRIRAQDTPNASGLSQSVSQIVYPPFSTTGSSLTGLSLNVISSGQPFTYAVDAYLDTAATEAYAKGTGTITFPSSGSAASVSVSMVSSIGPGYYDQAGLLHSFVSPKPLTLVYAGGSTTPSPLFVTVSSVDSQGLEFSYTIAPGSPESALLTYPVPNNASGGPDAAFTEPSPGFYAATSQSALGVQTLTGTPPNGAGVGLALVDGSTYMDPKPGSATPSVLPQAVIEALPQASTAMVDVQVSNIPVNAALLHVVLSESASGATEEFVADMPLANPPPAGVVVPVPVLSLTGTVYTISAVAYSGMDANDNPLGSEVAAGTGTGDTVTLVPAQGTVTVTANALHARLGGRK